MDIYNFKSDFPIFKRKVNGKELVYLDNAATTQMPVQVFDSIKDFEFSHRANVHRGVHTLSIEASEMYDDSRRKIAEFIGAYVPEEIIFTKNATESLNLIANSYGNGFIEKGDIILLSEVEHHANLVPWQILSEMKNAELRFIKVDDEGFFDIKNTQVDWNKIKIVALNHVSNVTGAIQDIKEVVKLIKKKYENQKPPVFVLDAAQSVPHMPVNVKSLGVDFISFSGHKMCGPFGIGVLWGRKELLKSMNPFLYGGGMIKSVNYDRSTFKDAPEKFEAGTPNISGAIGLASACDYLSKIGTDNIHNYENQLTKYAMEKLSKVEGIVIYGPKDIKQKAGIVSFNVLGIPAHDIAAVLDVEGVAVRSGHHCVMPWHLKNDITTTVRASFYFYNNESDIDALIKGIYKAKEIFK